jgi:hypothetical protein
MQSANTLRRALYATSPASRSGPWSLYSQHQRLHQQHQHHHQQASSFSTYLGAVNSTTLGFLQDKLIKQGERVSQQLHQNILLNANENSGLRHVELTPDHVRLEFSDVNDEYKKFARLMFASEEERAAMGVPQWLVPVDLLNNSYCGGGATVMLERRKVVDQLRANNAQRARSGSSSSSGAAGGSNKARQQRHRKAAQASSSPRV